MTPAAAARLPYAPSSILQIILMPFVVALGTSCVGQAADVTGDRVVGSGAALTIAVTVPDQQLTPSITITGPDGFRRTLNSSGTVDGLRDGEYHIHADTVAFADADWAPVPADQVVDLAGIAAAGGKKGAAVRYARATGSMVVRVLGLPTGAAAGVAVSGPKGYRATVHATDTLTRLVPGSYTISASMVTAGGAAYTPTAPSTRTDVSADSTPVEATVAFGTTRGSLAVSVSGLPNGSDGNVDLNGPNGYRTTLARSVILSDLEAGTYGFTAFDVTLGGQRWSALSPTGIATVGGGDSRIDIIYQVRTGSLAITTSGLPAGTDAWVVVTGAGFSRTIHATTVLSGLAPGQYTIRSDAVTVGGVTFSASPVEQHATIIAGSTAGRDVGYAVGVPTTGTLDLTVTGLPNGTTGSVTVTGPAGYQRSVVNSSSLTDLVPGNYVVVAANVGEGEAVLTPAPVSQTASVTAGTSAAATIAYHGANTALGTLALTISGLPSGTTGSAVVIGPGGYNRSVASSTVLGGLVPGSYSVQSTAVSSGGTAFQPLPPTQTLAVAAGVTATAAVAYQVTTPVTGALALTISGLPSGTAGSAVVTGPDGYTSTLTASTVLSGLVAGSYSVQSSAVSSGGTSFQASPPTQTLTVTAGATATAAVAYQVTTPATGGLAVTLNGLPSGTPGSVIVAGPGGYTRTLTTSIVLSGLVAGSYSVQSNGVSSGSTSFQASPATQAMTVVSGATANAAVTYTAVAAGGPQVTLNSSLRYQTIDGWATTLRMWDEDKTGDRFDKSVEQHASAAASYVVNNLGINAVRIEITSGMENPRNDWPAFYAGTMSYSAWSPGRYEKVNDNNNPNVANLSGFQFDWLDYRIETYLLPMKQAVEARGERLYINVNYLDFKWNSARQGTLSHANNPAEYAEFVLVMFQHMRTKYGIVPDAFEMILEPENTVGWTGSNIGRAIVAVSDRLAANGFTPEIIGPSPTAMASVAGLMAGILTVPGASSRMSTLVYHRYSTESKALVQSIATLARNHGLKTAMLEKVDAGIDQLMEDLIVGNVSGWQQWAMAGRSDTPDQGAYYARVNVGQSGSAAIGPARRAGGLAQVFRNVRRGAVRIGASSTATNRIATAFINPDGKWVAVIRATGSGATTINGLPAGRYIVSFTNEEGTTTAGQSVSVSGSYTAQIPSAGVLSVTGTN